MATKKQTGGQPSRSRHPGTHGTERKRVSSGQRGGARRERPGQSEAAAKKTTDHEFIRRWAEERGAKPTCVRGTGDKEDTGVLRLDFPGYSGEDSLQPISWDEWFQKFEEKKLALLFQDETKGGQKSNFNKLVARE